MAVNTVLGKVEKAQLGIISPHEHVFSDLSWAFVPPDDPIGNKIAFEPVCMKNLGVLRRNCSISRDNLIIDDFETACSELKEFRYAGGGTLVDATVNGIGRSPKMLRRAAVESGVNIVMGCGYYCAGRHPVDMDKRTVEELAEELLKELTNGVGDTGIKAGVIGEIGTSGQCIHPNEAKVLKAGAIAQKKTGAGVHVHMSDQSAGGNRFPFGLDVLDLFEENGADISKVCINHMGVKMGVDIEYCTGILKRGALLAFDTFGHEFYKDSMVPVPFETDIGRVRAIKQLCVMGFEKQILISCDICIKSHLHTYGGWGYDHIITNMIPVFRDEGFDEYTIKLFTVENPARFLDMNHI